VPHWVPRRWCSRGAAGGPATPDRRGARGLVGALALLLGGCCVLLGPPAAAHATLVSTDPAEGAVVRGPVGTVTATFDESVGVSPDSLRVFAPDGHRVDTGGTHVGTSSASVEVSLVPRLPRGTYTVAWHVVSADSHPVQGAFTFSIGHRSRHPADADVRPGSPQSVKVLYAVDRWLGYAGFVVVAGGAVFLAVCWPTGARDRRVRRLLGLAWLVSLLAVVLQVPLQGAEVAGAGMSGLLDPGVVPRAFDGRVGIALVVRVLALCYLLALALVLGVATDGDRRPSRRRFGSLFLLVTAFAALTWSMTGHAVTGTAWGLALVADATHLGSAAVWLGGLTLLVAAVLRDEGGGDRAAALTAARRFSPLAAWCVLAIVVTGVFQAWRNTRSWSALVGTEYGWLVCAKVGLLGLLVLLGLLARHTLRERPFRPRENDATDLRLLRRGVAAEALVAAVVLGVTAVLVQTPPARESYHPVATATVPFDTGSATGTLRTRLTPARLGRNRVVLRLTGPDGAPYRPAQVTASLTQQQAHVGPLTLRLRPTAPGTFVSDPVALGFAGRWALAVVIRSSAFDETTVDVEATIS